MTPTNWDQTRTLQSLPELSLVGCLVTPLPGSSVIPAAKLAENLERLVHALVGFLSVGIFRPLGGLRWRIRRPCSSLDLAAQSNTGLPLRPTLPNFRPRMNRSQFRCDIVAGSRFEPKSPTNMRIATRSCRWACSPFVGATSSP